MINKSEKQPQKNALKHCHQDIPRKTQTQKHYLDTAENTVAYNFIKRSPLLPRITTTTTSMSSKKPLKRKQQTPSRTTTNNH